MDFADKTLLVGVGAPKCGTSWLYGYLRDHPRIYMSPIKEMHVFNAWFRPDVSERWNERFFEKLEELEDKAASPPTPPQQRMLAAHRARVAMSTDLDQYIEFFRRNVGAHHTVFGESTPGYVLLREDGLRKLRSLHPRVRLIFVMRDPVERFWSTLRMRQRIFEGVDAAESFDRSWEDANLLERGRYDLTLEALDRVFPPRDVWIGFYETLFTPARIGALCAWIGVGYRPADFERHPNRAPRVELTPSQRAFAREQFAPVYSYCRARFGDRLPAEWMA